MLNFRRTSIKSISDSVFEEIFENGRRYADGDYFLPNDDDEETRASIVHQAYIAALMGELSLNRIPPTTPRVLDVGAGPGDWAIAVAELLPNAEVVATDIWPFEPTDIPQNLYYQIDDAREEWNYTEPFNLIHMRGLAGAFPDWDFIYAQAYKHTTDFGILEIADWTSIRYNREEPDSYLHIYNGACQSAAEKAGISLNLEHLRKEKIEEVGFRILRRATIEVPIGPWHPDPRKASLSKMALVAAMEGLEAQSLRLLTKYLDWSVEDVKDLCNKVKDEMSVELQPTLTCQFVVARKIVIEG